LNQRSRVGCQVIQHSATSTHRVCHIVLVVGIRGAKCAKGVEVVARLDRAEVDIETAS
jgi:hypothetical protein